MDQEFKASAGCIKSFCITKVHLYAVSIISIYACYLCVPCITWPAWKQYFNFEKKIFFEPLKTKPGLGVVVHIFNASTQEVEAGGSL